LPSSVPHARSPFECATSPVAVEVHETHLCCSRGMALHSCNQQFRCRCWQLDC
jgi:hypothetical protein